MIEVTYDDHAPSGLACHLGMPPMDPTYPWSEFTFCARVWVDDYVGTEWAYVSQPPDIEAHPDLQARRADGVLEYRWIGAPDDVARYRLSEGYLVTTEPFPLYLCERTT